MPNTYVIAVDDSANAEKAFAHAANTLPKEDKFVVFHGRHQSSHIPSMIKESEMREYAEHSHIVEKYKKICSDFNRTCQFVDTRFQSISELGKKINDVAYEKHASGIVMGTRGLSAPERVVLGSTSYSVLAQANIPVTIVKQ